jgi:hypothetical protein
MGIGWEGTLNLLRHAAFCAAHRSDAHGAAANAKPGIVRHGDHRRAVRAFCRHRRLVEPADLAARIWPIDDLAAPVAICGSRRRHRTCPRTMPMVVAATMSATSASRMSDDDFRERKS